MNSGSPLWRRLIELPLMLLIASALTFAMIQAAPGDFARLIDNPSASPMAREQLRKSFGLDQPPIGRYLAWLSSASRGDLGASYLYQRPVRVVIGEALGPTLILTGSALVLQLVLGLLAALVMLRRGPLGRLTDLASLLAYGLPGFWIAVMAVLAFAVHLDWLPPSHMASVGADELGRLESIIDQLAHLVLPASCLALAGAAATARYFAASLRDLSEAPFLVAAKARGLSRLQIFVHHALRPALIPVVTLLGLSLPMLLSGAVVIESIFSWPGLGRLAWTAAQGRDVPLLLGVTLLSTVGVVLGSLIADLGYRWLDPRQRS